MARRRFFVPEIRRGMAELAGPDAEHLVRVLRVKRGQIFEICDNRKLYLAEVETVRKSLVGFRITEELTPAPARVQISLFAALIKFDRFEWLIEKATELGVSSIQPFEAARTERGLAQASIKRLPRWRKIALEASQQSRRAHLPVIEPALSFEEAIRTEADRALLLDELPDSSPVLAALPAERKPEDRVALLLGPEGGWTNEERAEAHKRGWISCSLGATVLRAETATVAALAIIQAAWAAPQVQFR